MSGALTITIEYEKLLTLIAAASECWEDLESELGNRYSDRVTDRVQMRRYVRDVDVCRRVREAINAMPDNVKVEHSKRALRRDKPPHCQ